MSRALGGCRERHRWPCALGPLSIHAQDAAQSAATGDGRGCTGGPGSPFRRDLRGRGLRHPRARGDERQERGVSGGCPVRGPMRSRWSFAWMWGFEAPASAAIMSCICPWPAGSKRLPSRCISARSCFCGRRMPAGLSGPVEGESDLPGMDLGVMPVDESNQVDLSRLQRLVTKKTLRRRRCSRRPIQLRLHR